GDSRASPRSGTRQPPRSAGPASCSTTSGAQGRALRRAGVDELTIMALGGWRTRAMFARYSITDSRDLADAQAKLNAAFVGAPRTVLPLRRVVGDNLGTVNSNGVCGADSASKKAVNPRRTKWPGAGLNRRHRDFQSRALPTELPGRSAERTVSRSAGNGQTDSPRIDLPGGAARYSS